MAATLKTGALDLSAYLRVAQGEGLDPVSEDHITPGWAETPLAEGQALVSIDAGNQAFVMPLRLAGKIYKDAVMGDQPISYWRLGEASGTTSTDSKGTNTGTYAGGVTLAQAGAIGDGDTAALFNGSTGRSDIPDAANLRFTTAFTFEAWVFPTASGTEAVILCKNASTDYEWRLDTANPPKQQMTGLAVSGSAVPLNAWSHLAVTYDGTNVRYYLNGVLDGTVASAAFPSSTNAARIGARTSGSLWFTGSLDEVAVYDHALTVAQISRHYQAGPAANSKDALHNLVARVNRSLTSGASVEWKDTGASNSTFYTLAFGKFDPEFNYRRSEHNYADGTLHLACTPYGTTGTTRLAATALGSGPMLLIPVPSVGGDTLALAKYQVTMGGQDPRAGRVVGIGVLPNPSYLTDIPAASFTSLGAGASLVSSASGAVGSQYLTVLATQSLAFRGALPIPTAHIGRNRIFALARSKTDPGFAISALDDSAQPIGPTAIASSCRDWQLVDLGVLSIPSSGPVPSPYSLTFQIGPVASQQVAVPSWGMEAHVNRVYLLPEDSTAYVVDGPGAALAADEFTNASATTLAGQLDQLGNSWATYGSFAAPVYSPATAGGMVTTATSAQALNQHPGVIDSIARLDFVVAGNVPGVGLTQAAIVKNQTAFGGTYIFAGLYWNSGAGSGIPALALSAASAAPVATLPLATFPDGRYELTLETRQFGVTAKLRACGSAPLTPLGGSATDTIVLSAPSLGHAQIAGQYGVIAGSATSTLPVQLRRFTVNALTGSAPAASDVFTVDETNTSAHRTPQTGVGPLRLEAKQRGQAPKLTPGATTTVAVLAHPVPGGGGTDPLAVQISVRERFLYAR